MDIQVSELSQDEIDTAKNFSPDKETSSLDDKINRFYELLRSQKSHLF